MSQRLVLVEGPDDVAALRELGTRLFLAKKKEQASKPGARRKEAFISPSGISIELSIGLNAKDGLPKAVLQAVNGLPAQISGDEARTEKMAVFYDPDADKPGDFEARIDKELKALASSWKVQKNTPGHWLLRRDQEEAIELRAIAWKGAGALLDGLPDEQNLERLICQIMGSAYAGEQQRIETWLTAIQGARPLLKLKAPKWKAATLLWAALVDDQATSEVGIASRFMGQHKYALGGDFFKDHIEPCVKASGLDEPLGWVFA